MSVNIITNGVRLVTKACCEIIRPVVQVIGLKNTEDISLICSCHAYLTTYVRDYHSNSSTIMFSDQ